MKVAVDIQMTRIIWEEAVDNHVAMTMKIVLPGEEEIATVRAVPAREEAVPQVLHQTDATAILAIGKA